MNNEEQRNAEKMPEKERSAHAKKLEEKWIVDETTCVGPVQRAFPSSLPFLGRRFKKEDRERVHDNVSMTSRTCVLAERGQRARVGAVPFLGADELQPGKSR